MLGEFTFLPPPRPLEGSTLGWRSNWTFVYSVCVHMCTLPLAGHAQVLPPIWNWGQGTAAATLKPK